MNANIQIIAKEGWLGAGVWAFIFLVSAYLELGIFTFIVFLALVFWLYMFRNPERIEDLDPTSFAAPIDGVIKNIDILEDSVCVQIQTRCYDIGVIRAPRDILQSTLKCKNGLSLFFSSADKKRLLNASFSLSWQERGETYRMEFFPEFFNTSHIYTTSDLAMGDRCGYMKIGLTKIYLPKTLEIKANVGDKVYACESVIGYSK
ncbi:phosphatidylserine decarboxylase [uncultured Helicobacter sp.]|uniref:phosphatidylserine decarboxylase n=1 Tax=uncultured Helicobacter sp. TaxID=175537 RepID=UPI001C3B5F8C|nr:phosphatidylserine decarboxylase [Candidatus Helicobacter avicola]